MIRQWVEGFGAVAVTAAVTLLSVILAVALAAGLDLLIKGFIARGDLLVAGLIAAILAPLMTYSFIRLSQQLAEAEERLRILATVDDLTQAFNRRQLLALAQLEWERAERYQRELSLAILDIDHFKRINDSYGHQLGDRVLRQISQLCQSELRRPDRLGRYGGEEFILLLPETGAQEAVVVAERLRQSIENHNFLTPSGKVGITASFGVATLSSKTPDIDALLRYADEALYIAKSEGRNKVVLSD
ncbi:MAG: GGDEF domain-containing protein [Anaerolineales bacterium]